MAAWAPHERGLAEQVLRGQTVVASVTSSRSKQTYLDLLAWADDRGLYVYVGRRMPPHWTGGNPYVRGPFDWANPYKLGRDGDRTTIIESFEHLYLPGHPDLIDRLPELDGKVLGCWCAPEHCHGDVLARLCHARH
jgi:hypothetical protein